MNLKVCGIYKINNNINNHFYIGSSINIHKRWYNHTNLLKLNKHTNIHLQRAWNLYGKHSFECIVLEICSPDILRDREQHWLNQTATLVESYNIAIDAYVPSRGLIQSEISNIKRSISLRGRKLSSEHKLKIGNSNRGNVIGKLGRYNMSRSHIGKKLTIEHKHNISKSLQTSIANKKLTANDVLYIRSMYPQKSSRALAKMFNLKDKKTILNIIHHKTWNYI